VSACSSKSQEIFKTTQSSIHSKTLPNAITFFKRPWTHLNRYLQSFLNLFCDLNGIYPAAKYGSSGWRRFQGNDFLLTYWSFTKQNAYRNPYFHSNCCHYMMSRHRGECVLPRAVWENESEKPTSALPRPRLTLTRFLLIKFNSNLIYNLIKRMPWKRTVLPETRRDAGGVLRRRRKDHHVGHRTTRTFWVMKGQSGIFKWGEVETDVLSPDVGTSMLRSNAQHTATHMSRLADRLASCIDGRNDAPAVGRVRLVTYYK